MLMSREAVLSVALELFALRGVDGVSIADIADGAGMSKANVLHHFGSKDRLYRACLEAVGERLEAVAEAVSGVDGDRVVEALGVELNRWAADHPDDLRLMAYGLLRLRERTGPWVLEGAIASIMRTLGGTPEQAGETVITLLGRVTYAVIAEPLRAAFEATAQKTRSTSAVPN